MHAPMLIQFGIIASVAAIAAIGGFLIGTAGNAWRRRFEQERIYYRAYREQADARQAQSRARIAELEAAAPVMAAAEAPATIEAAHDEPAEPEPEMQALAIDQQPAHIGEHAGELTRIRGIDEALAGRLSALGVYRFDDIEEMSAEDEIALEIRLGLPAGIIMRDQWRLQARLLGPGGDRAQNAHSGAPEAV